MSKARDRDKELQKKAKRRYTVNDDQRGVVQYVMLHNTRLLHIGLYSYRRQREDLNGVQVENKFYHVKNGVVRMLYINKPGNAVEQVYPSDPPPRWAKPELVALYEEKKKALSHARACEK